MIVRGIRARPKGKTAPHAAQGLNEQKCVGGWAFRTNLDKKQHYFSHGSIQYSFFTRFYIVYPSFLGIELGSRVADIFFDTRGDESLPTCVRALPAISS